MDSCKEKFKINATENLKLSSIDEISTTMHDDKFFFHNSKIISYFHIEFQLFTTFISSNYFYYVGECLIYFNDRLITIGGRLNTIDICGISSKIYEFDLRTRYWKVDHTIIIENSPGRKNHCCVIVDHRS